MRGVGRAPVLAGVANAGGCFGLSIDEERGGEAVHLPCRFTRTRRQAALRSVQHPSSVSALLAALGAPSHLLPQGAKVERYIFALANLQRGRALGRHSVKDKLWLASGELMSKVIKNGTIVTADRTWKADVLVKHDKIVGDRAGPAWRPRVRRDRLLCDAGRH